MSSSISKAEGDSSYSMAGCPARVQHKGMSCKAKHNWMSSGCSENNGTARQRDSGTARQFQHGWTPTVRLRWRDSRTGQNSTVLHCTATIDPRGAFASTVTAGRQCSVRRSTATVATFARDSTLGSQPARHEFGGQSSKRGAGAEESTSRRARRGEGGKTWGTEEGEDSTVLRRDRRNRGGENTEGTQREYDTGWTPTDHRENTIPDGSRQTTERIRYRMDPDRPQREYRRPRREHNRIRAYTPQEWPPRQRVPRASDGRGVYSPHQRRRIRREYAGATPTRRQRWDIRPQRIRPVKRRPQREYAIPWSEHVQHPPSISGLLSAGNPALSKRHRRR
jgi:hypothetical protein